MCRSEFNSKLIGVNVDGNSNKFVYENHLKPGVYQKAASILALTGSAPLFIQGLFEKFQIYGRNKKSVDVKSVD